MLQTNIKQELIVISFLIIGMIVGSTVTVYVFSTIGYDMEHCGNQPLECKEWYLGMLLMSPFVGVFIFIGNRVANRKQKLVINDRRTD